MNKKQTDISPSPRYSRAEEITNSITHGIGVALSVAALVILVVFSSLYGDVWRIVSFSIYGSTLVILYLTSTLYHSFTNPKVKSFFQLMDHVSIFLLIAGTYTPLTLTVLRGPWGWTIFGLIWSLAIIGIIYETLFLNKYAFVSVSIYLGMGWLAVIAIKPLLTELPPGMLKWIVIGGLCYSIGVLFYLWEKIPFNHAIWHLFVLAGSITHFLGIFFYLT